MAQLKRNGGSERAQYSVILVNEKKHQYYIESSSYKGTVFNVDKIAFIVYQQIEDKLESKLSSFALFHGGAVQRNNCNIVLFGPTRTGKSTLLAYLAYNGWTYLSDDHIIIYENKIIPFRMPIALRSDNYIKNIVNEHCVLVSSNTYDKTHFLSNFKIHEEISGAINIFVVLNRIKPNTSNLKECFQRLSSGQKYYHFVHNLKVAKNVEDWYITCLDLARKSDVYIVNYETLRGADRILNGLLRQGGDVYGN